MFKGSIVALITPFSDGQVDEDALRKLVDWHVEQGTNGIVPCGTTGESPTLSHEEHGRVVEIVVKQAAGRVPIIAGAGSNNTAEAVALTQHAEAAGADAVLHVAGYYNRPNQEGLYQHFKALHDASDIPIMIHGTHDMDASVIGQLIDKFPQIEYVKEETSHGPKLRQYVKEFGDRITFFGPGLHYPAELEWGALGVMPSCCAPHAHARVFDLWQEGHHAESRREWNRMLPLVFWRWHTAAGEAGKHYLKHLGIFSTPYVRQQVALPGQHDGAQASFGNLRLDEVDIQEMLTILATMGEPPY